MGDHLRSAIRMFPIVCGVLALVGCGDEAASGQLPSTPADPPTTWTLPDELARTAVSMAPTSEGLVVSGVDSGGFTFAVSEGSSGGWSVPVTVTEGEGWHVVSAASGPSLVWAVCDGEVTDVGCEDGQFRLRAGEIGSGAIRDESVGPRLPGVTGGSVDLQSVAFGNDLVVAVRTAVDESTLYRKSGSDWTEAGRVDAVRRMCSTDDALFIQSAVVTEVEWKPDPVGPELTKIRSGVPGVMPDDTTSTSVEGVAGARVGTPGPSGNDPMDTVGIPLVMRELTDEGLSDAYAIGSTITGSLDGELACTADAALVFAAGRWAPISANGRTTVRSDPGDMQEGVIVPLQGPSGRVRGLLEVADVSGEWSLTAHVVDGPSPRMPDLFGGGTLVLGAAELGPHLALLLSESLDSSQGSHEGEDDVAERKVVLVPNA